MDALDVFRSCRPLNALGLAGRVVRLLPSPYAEPLQRNGRRFMPQIVIFPNRCFRELQPGPHTMPFAI